MNKLNRSLLFLPLVLLASLGLAQTASLPAATVTQIESLIKSQMAAKNLPSVGVGIWIPGQGNYVAAFGKSDLKSGRNRQVGDPFRIASITKTFTATAILLLADQGDLSLSDPIAKWYPAFPNANQITVKNLLMMRSGMADFADDKLLEVWYRDPLAPLGPQEAIRMTASQAAKFSAPDQKTRYNNSNFVLLEQIVEKASGQDISSFLQANVFAPLGMKNTAYPSDTRLPGGLRGYSWEAESKSFRDVTEVNPALPGGAGAMISTLDDLRVYVRAICRGGLLKPATQAARLEGMPMDGEPPFIRYAQGLLQLGPLCGHNGTIFGFSSEAFYLPSKDAVIVINVNRLDLDDASKSTELLLLLTKLLFPSEVNW
jgi:D-alanyl-D-alanine carboxypeptidase